MNRVDRINGRKVGIIGMARSGLSAAELVMHLGGHPFVSDVLPIDKLTSAITRLEQSNIKYECGRHSDKLLECDYLILSPGIPSSLDILQKAQEAGLPIISEIELAYWVCRGRVLAVTGSNGKTTTVTLLGEICKESGRPTVVGGNIGTPFSSITRDVPENGLAVIELSSFQLERIEQFAPHAGVLLNLTPDHLDRYDSFDSYCRAKLRLFENQAPEHFSIVNSDDSVTARYQIPGQAKRLTYSIEEDKLPAHTTEGVFKRGTRLIGCMGGQEHDLVGVDEIQLPGRHNLANAAAASAAALACGIAPEVIGRVLKRFAGVEHRLEEVAVIGGVRFVNDSKGTNVDAVIVALESISTKVNLIAGGRDKAGDFTRLIKPAAGKLANIILIGEAKDKIFEQVGREISTVMATSMADAVRRAFDLSRPGDTVLLSPGCASFDMYRNFEERGHDFMNQVRKLKNGKGSGQKVEA